MSVLRAALASLLVAACGDNLSDPSSVQGGDRLRLIEYIYEDGFRERDLEVFHDAARDERCEVRLFSDGARYCAPESAAGETVFVDASCSRSLGLVPVETAAPPYFTRYYELHGERLPSRLYPSGARTDAPTQVWLQQDGFCLGPVAAMPAEYYELGEEILPSAFVRIRESDVREGERLALGTDTSSDGLRVPGALYDQLVMQRCELAGGANAGEVACVPRELPRASYYGDPGCTQPVVALAASTATDLGTHHASSTDCWSLLEVGAPLDPAAPIYEPIGAACVAVPRPGGTVAYATGASLDVAIAARVTAPAQTTRLSLVELQHGALRIPDRFLFDAELGAECRRERRDGEHVCVPHASTRVQTVFADDACSTTLSLAFLPVGGCHAPARFATDGAAHYPIGAPYAQPFYELEPGDRCGTFEAPPGLVAHALLPALDAASLPRARAEIDYR